MLVIKANKNALKINYNNLDEFIDAIIKIKTPVNFEDIGLLDEGMPQQISTGILQIENELYDIVRPKDLVQRFSQQVF